MTLQTNARSVGAEPGAELVAGTTAGPNSSTPTAIAEVGPKLIENQYFPIAIRRGEKRPENSRWQAERLTPEDCGDYNGGAGILCGQGDRPVGAMDVDTTNAALAEAFEGWCLEHLGDAPIRIGNAPKRLLVYRAAESGWRKQRSRQYRHGTDERLHHLEVLGAGQQFVGYGIHPGTGRPYEWVDLMGGLTHWPAQDLAVVTAAQVVEAIAEFQRLAESADYQMRSVVSPRNGATLPAPDPDNPFGNDPGPIDVTDAEIVATLDALDAEEYDQWNRVGMALYHQFGGDHKGLDLWDDWSSKASSYADRNDLEMRWGGFAVAQGVAPTTWRSVLAFAAEAEADARRADVEESRRALTASIAACQDADALLTGQARDAGFMARTSPALRIEAEGLLQDRFHEITGRKIPIGTVRQAMKDGAALDPPPPGKGPVRALTEFGLADRVVDKYGCGLMYVAAFATWSRWTGTQWEKVDTDYVRNLVAEVIRTLPLEVDRLGGGGDREAFFKFCSKVQQAPTVGHVVKLLQADPAIAVPARELDRDPMVLGTANGAVDLLTGEFLPPDPLMRITRIATAEYYPGAACPLFEQTVLEVFGGDQEMAAFWQRLMGYSLMGNPKEHILVIPYGNGCNGKSTVLGAVQHALGKHAATAAADVLLNNQGASGGSNHQEGLLRLRGARLVTAAEPDGGAELREGLVKSMTGGDVMACRAPYAKHSVEFTPSWVVLMPTNHKPIIKSDDHGIWRRLMPIPFLRNFDTDATATKDVNRQAKLRAEASGILAWCVRGALAYQADGLAIPQVVKAARDAYRSDMDLLQGWLDEDCEIGPGVTSTPSELWASWEWYAKLNGDLQYIRSSRALGKRLGNRFTPDRNSKGRFWRGIRPRTAPS